MRPAGFPSIGSHLRVFAAVALALCAASVRAQTDEDLPATDEAPVIVGPEAGLPDAPPPPSAPDLPPGSAAPLAPVAPMPETSGEPAVPPPSAAPFAPPVPGDPILPGEPPAPEILDAPAVPAGPASAPALRAAAPEPVVPLVDTPVPPVPLATQTLRAEAECTRILRLSVDKSERQIAATCSSGAVRSFRVALGQLPFGYKREQYDLRTPEGFYRIAEAPRGSRFHVFMLLDYPSLADADRALSTGYITPRTYLRIARAVARGELPPQDTLLGGVIGIHGEGAAHRGRSTREDWTLGCIALSDADAAWIAERVGVGTPVSIEP